MKHHVERVRSQVGKIISRQPPESCYQRSGGFDESHREEIRLVFKVPGEGHDERLQEEAQLLPKNAKQEEADIRFGRCEVKSGIERWPIDQEMGQVESTEHEDFKNKKLLHNVLTPQMPHLVGKNGEYFLMGVGFQHCVEEDDLLRLPKACEVSVGVATAQTGIHLENSADGNAVLFHEHSDPVRQFIVPDRLESVEERSDDHGVELNQCDLHN